MYIHIEPDLDHDLFYEVVGLWVSFRLELESYLLDLVLKSYVIFSEHLPKLWAQLGGAGSYCSDLEVLLKVVLRSWVER